MSHGAKLMKAGANSAAFVRDCVIRDRCVPEGQTRLLATAFVYTAKVLKFYRRSHPPIHVPADRRRGIET